MAHLLQRSDCHYTISFLVPHHLLQLYSSFHRSNPPRAAKGGIREASPVNPSREKGRKMRLSHVVPPFSKRRRKTCWNKNTTKEQPFPKPAPIAARDDGAGHLGPSEPTPRDTPKDFRGARRKEGGRPPLRVGTRDDLQA